MKPLPPSLRLDVHRLALQTLVKKRKTELRWRSARERFVRRLLAWAFNISIMVISYLYAVIISVKFGDAVVRGTFTTWLVAYGWTFSLVEPLQICLLVCAPCLWREDSRCGRCMGWVRYVYNELLSP